MFTFAGKYMWRGFDVYYNDDPAFQPSINFDIFDSGFSFNVWGSTALDNRDDHEELDEVDYTLAYGFTLFPDDPYAMEVSLNFIYYAYPQLHGTSGDVLELGGGISMPNLFPIGESAIVPSYYGAWLHEADEDEEIGPLGGGYHKIALGYDWLVPALIAEQETQAISFTADIHYTDGYFDLDADFTHSTVGVSTSFEYKGFAVSPAVNYQFTFDDDDENAINDEDEFWATLSVSYSFNLF